MRFRSGRLNQLCDNWRYGSLTSSFSYPPLSFEHSAEDHVLMHFMKLQFVQNEDPPGTAVHEQPAASTLHLDPAWAHSLPIYCQSVTPICKYDISPQRSTFFRPLHTYAVMYPFFLTHISTLTSTTTPSPHAYTHTHTNAHTLRLRQTHSHTHTQTQVPIEPIETSIGVRIQDPRLFRGLWAQSWIAIEPIEISIGACIQDPGSKILPTDPRAILDLGSDNKIADNVLATLDYSRKLCQCTHGRLCMSSETLLQSLSAS